MTFTGINYKSIASSKTLTLDLDSVVLYFSGDKYDSTASGFNFGFSGTSNGIGFKGVSGKIYDPEGRVVYGYSEQTPFSMSFSVNESNYDYYFNDVLYCSNGQKTDFTVDKFYFNSNGLTAEVDFRIHGPQIEYEFTFPENFSGSLFTGNFNNLSDSNVKIFTGRFTNGNTEFFSPLLINNVSVNANTSGAIVLSGLVTETGIGCFTTLELYTNFGVIEKAFSVYKS